MKKLLSVVIAVMMLFAFTSVAFAAVSDIAGHWAAADIQALIDKGIVSGDDTGKFNPEGKVTREQYAKMVVLAKGLAVENPATATFSDVPKTAWSYGYVEAAAKAGLIKGFDGKFNPAANITRQDVAVIVARALNLDTTGTPDFSDAASIAAYAKGSVAAAAKAGIVKGADGKFNPTASATRAEASVMTLRQTLYVAPVKAGLVTDYNWGAKTVVIDSKSKTVTTDLMVFAGATKVGTRIIKKDTHVSADYTSTSDTANIYRITVDPADYVIKTGSVTENGQDASNKYFVLDGNKIYYDKDKALFIDTTNSDGDVVAASETVPQVNTKYLVAVDKKGLAYYLINVTGTAASGTITSVGNDATGDYIVIDSKKYYAYKGTDGKAVGASVYIVENSITQGTNQWAKVKAKMYGKIETLRSDGSIERLAITTDLSAAVITSSAKYVLNSGVYDIYFEVTPKNADGSFSGTSFNMKSSTTVSTLPSGVAAVAAPGSVKLTKDVMVTMDGVSSTFENLKKGSYAEFGINSDGNITTIKALSAAKSAVKGQIEDIVKGTNSADDDTYNKIQKIKIAGKEYTYAGKSTADSASDQGTLYTTSAHIVIAEDDLASFVLNSAGEIVGLSPIRGLYTENGTVIANQYQIVNATIAAVGGDKSIMSSVANQTYANPQVIYVPDNTIEVKYWTGSSWAYAWVGQVKNKGIDQTEKTVKTTFVGVSGLGDLKVGDIVNVGITNVGPIATFTSAATNYYNVTVTDAPTGAGYNATYFTGNKYIWKVSAPVNYTSYAADVIAKK